MPGTSDGLLCDPGVPIGLDLQDSHLGGRARSGRGKGWVGLGELAGRRAPGYTGLVPLVHTSQRRRCPQQCHQQPLKEESRSGWVRRMRGAGWGPPGFTSILWREEVQVPRFLPLNTDGTSKIIGERYGRAGGEQTGPLHSPPSPRVPTHRWRRSGATLRRSPQGESAGVNVTGCAASSALCSQQVPPSPASPVPPRRPLLPATPSTLPAPEPILMRPLCWMKMVSLVRFPWMMGGLQACRKLEERAGGAGSGVPGGGVCGGDRRQVLRQAQALT